MGVSKKECSTFSWERTWGDVDGTVWERQKVYDCVCGGRVGEPASSSQ
jgi:hypothetical protein